MSTLSWSSGQAPTGTPVFFSGSLTVPQASPVPDTYIRLPGWTKGIMWVNGFNIGRYWNPKGPQNNFYIPGTLLQQGPPTASQCVCVCVCVCVSAYLCCGCGCMCVYC
ncbi:MAG: hypothetical protein P4N59_16010, partial [Negativicutes bacterium]|nr:hypothetical protein [Negativicutes bacterium]